MKYELTEQSIEFEGKTLYRIKALRDIELAKVKLGDLGGYIEKEANLPQEDDSWVYSRAKVYGNVTVSGNALISGNAKIYGDATVSDDAKIYGDATIRRRMNK